MRDIASICIVTPDYLSSTPRVVKEADALAAAGFQVRVVCAQGSLEHLREFDARLCRDKKWTFSAVGWSSARPPERWLYAWSWWRYHVARGVSRLSAMGRFLEHAQSRIYNELADLAISEPADLYIGHYPAGLAAAAYAAKHYGAALGYDMEDLYTGHQPDGAKENVDHRRIAGLEKKYLPLCRHVTAASTGIADEAARLYGIPAPLVLHNVFPWADRGQIDGLTKDRQGPALSLYWYSQVIGEGRGLEEAIRAVGLLRVPAQLHLRGECSPVMKKKLLSLAKTVGLRDRVFLHPPVHPEELLSRAVEHDVGLALETPRTLNHRLTVSNKLFLYLLAGLAVAASDTPGQSAILRSCPQAGFLYPSGNVGKLAEGFAAYGNSGARLRQAKDAALAAARDRWNWEQESRRLMESLQSPAALREAV